MYHPKRVFFEENALNYPLGKRLYNLFSDKDIETVILTSNRVTGIPKKNQREFYVEGKNSLVIRVWKKTKFQSCKPSAHYQMPLVSGCSGKCEYCYLNTRFGNKPYITLYVNIDDILNQAESYIGEQIPRITIFEGAATSDPIPFEPYTGSLAKAIEFFGKEAYGRFRFVSKFGDVDSLLDLDHRGHTTIRFSINTDKVIKDYEHGTDRLDKRILGAKKILESGYPLGFIIGPVIMYDKWKEDYLEMLKRLKDSMQFNGDNEIRFEVISHRFTKTAKNKILEIFPKSSLPMVEEDRTFKYGQFGYGKYVYSKEQINDMKAYFENHIKDVFPKSSIDYMI